MDGWAVTTGPVGALRCEICLRGRLDASWAAWFDGMAVCAREDADGRPVTLLSGEVTDASALYGLLRRVRDLALPLLSVSCVRR